MSTIPVAEASNTYNLNKLAPQNRNTNYEPKFGSPISPLAELSPDD
jgi:hypothetical protein